MEATKKEENGPNGELISQEAANDLLVKAKQFLKQSEKPSIEWEGEVIDIGLSGVVFFVKDEQKLWATKRMFAPHTKVSVRVEKA